MNKRAEAVVFAAKRIMPYAAAQLSDMSTSKIRPTVTIKSAHERP